MKKVISSINITLDGFCNHTAMIASVELHQKANELLRNADIMLFGRVTYQLMESAWPLVVKNPTGIKATDEFAVLIDNMPKIVFSNTLEHARWKNTTLAKGGIEDEVKKLKEQPGGNILVGGPSVISQLMQLDLIDEYHFWLQPIILGQGLALFKNITDRIDLKLLDAKTYQSGVLSLTYTRIKR